MLRFFLLHLRFNDGTGSLWIANEEISLELPAEETKYLMATGEENARQESQLEDRC
jgi:hypothetical protein